MFILLLIFSLSSFAASDFNLSQVEVICPQSITCSQRTGRFSNLIGEYRSLVHLKDTLRVMATDGGYQSFSYVLEKFDDTYSLKINFQMKPVIKEISIGFTDRNLEFDPTQLLNVREGEYFESQRLTESLGSLREKLEEMGFPHNTYKYETKITEEDVKINLVITLGKPRIFKSVSSNSKSTFVKEYLIKKFYNMYNKPFDTVRFKAYVDDAQKELFSYGYYLIGLDFTPTFKEDRVSLKIKVTNDQLFAFDFKNLSQEHRDILHAIIVDLFRKYKRPLSESNLKSALQEHYQLKALLRAKISIEQSTFKNKYYENVQLYRLFFDENQKTRLKDLSFNGNVFFSNEKLQKMFFKEAFELASLKYYDEEFFKYFQEYLKNEYIQKGFVQVRIPDPSKSFEDNKSLVNVEYNIQEGTRAFLRRIEFNGLPPELEDKVHGTLENKVGAPFNPIALSEDIKKVTTLLQESGYYYAEVKNLNEDSFINYSKSGANVDILFEVNAGPIVKLNRVLYLGNDKTKKKVIWKKIGIEPGEIITPAKTKDIEAALSATGLFATATVTPLRHNSKNAATDLLVKVTEREYGLIEVAPGFRSDLGLKLTGTVSYLNLGGYNRAVVLRSQLNRRTSYSTIAPSRRGTGQILEHNTSVTYTQGDIFDTLIDGSASAAYQTKRFYPFDANIFRINGTLTRDITKRFSTSVRYQYEDVAQYDAVEEKDNGSFKIGAITPSITYDLRSSQVNPLKGAYFNMSCEFANPYFLSQKERDLTVNYYKLISRNRFYIPFKNGTVALSLVGGVQENLSREKVMIDGVEQTNGYIPSIKVFRLTGMDIVRGYSDQDMNRLPDGEDITSAKINNRAYLANFKLEPRYMINDTLMAGVFYDAGRVFVNNVDLGELKDSVGVTFKVLTPVGTLDFDYGIKLLRKRDANGTLEDPGRFHVSIGFF